MRSFFQDLRYAVRTLRSQPGFTAVALVARALGIGASTASFSAVSAVLLRPLPYPGGERLVRVWETFPPTQGRGSVSGPNFDDWQAQATTMETWAAIRYDNASVSGGEARAAERLRLALVSPGFFPIVAAAPVVGRAFTDAEYRAGNEREVVITHGLWQRRYGGDPGVVGRTIDLSGQPHVVVGVLGRSFSWVGNRELDALLPLARGAGRSEQRGSHYLTVIGRLAPGVTATQARADLDAVAARLAAAYPDAQSGRGVALEPLHDAMVGRTRPALLVFLGAVLLVLVIACANVANMLLARAAARQGEISVRVALGASRGRLVRQLLTESLLLAALGGGLGLLVAVWGIDLLGVIQKHEVPGAPPLALDGVTLAFAALVTLASVVLFGLVPALRASRTDVAAALKESARSTTGGGQRLRALLVIGQTAMSLALLVGAGLLLRSFVSLTHVPLGFDPEHVLTAEINLSTTHYGDDARVAAFYRELVARVRGIPGVTAAGVVDFVPLSQSNMNGDFELEGQAFAPGQTPVTEFLNASPDTFRALGMRLAAGRGFTDADDAHAPAVAVINATMARRYFAGKDPVGQRLKLGWDDEWRTIVGVVADTRRFTVAAEPVPETYVPEQQRPFPNMSLVVRTQGAPESVAAAVAREALALDPAEALYDVRPLTASVSESVAQRRFAMLLIGVFAVIAVLLAGLGIYSVISVQVTQRTRELGLRMALGAQQADVRRMVVARGMALAGGGVLVGVALAALTSRVLTSLLYGVALLDPITYGAVVALLLAVAFLASFLPARRATRIDPMVALRSS